MICCKAGVLIEAMNNCSPDILNASKQALNKTSVTSHQSPFYKIPFEEMAEIPELSIDHALLEKIPCSNLFLEISLGVSGLLRFYFHTAPKRWRRECRFCKALCRRRLKEQPHHWQPPHDFHR